MPVTALSDREANIVSGIINNLDNNPEDIHNSPYVLPDICFTPGQSRTDFIYMAFRCYLLCKYRGNNDLINCLEQRGYRFHNDLESQNVSGTADVVGACINQSISGAIIVEHQNSRQENWFILTAILFLVKFSRMADFYRNTIAERETPVSAGTTISRTTPATGSFPYERIQNFSHGVGLFDSFTQPVNELNTDDGTIRRRTSEDSRNDDGHNLTVQYQRTYVRYKGNFVLIDHFERASSDKVHVYFYKANSDGTWSDAHSRTTYIPDEWDLSAPIELGWTPTKEGMYYIEYIPGTYLRALSRNNTRIPYIIESDSNGACSLNYADTRYDADILSKIYNPTYRDIKEVLDNPFVALNSRIAAAAFNTEAGIKRLLFYNAFCIGEFVERKPFIKIYKSYSRFIPELQKEIPNYELR